MIKKLQFIVLAMLFAITSVEFIDAKTKKPKQSACPKGQIRVKGSACHKLTAKEKENKNIEKAKKHEDNSTAMKATTLANNAINAYNKGIADGIDQGDAIQTAAINAINNLLNVYNSYLSIIQKCDTAGTVTFITKASESTSSANLSAPMSQAQLGQNSFGNLSAPMSQAQLGQNSFGNLSAPMSQAQLGQNSFGSQSAPIAQVEPMNQNYTPSSSAGASNGFSCPNSPSQCDDGSTATCDDNTPIGQFVCEDATPSTSLGSPCADGSTSTYACDDNSIPDANGVCGDGSLMMCGDYSNPSCSDGTSAC